jgi:transposase
MKLDFKVELECSERTIRRAMKTMNYHKCIADRKRWVNEKTACWRFEWVTFMKNRCSDKTSWRRVQFSDEVHFEWGRQGKLLIIKKSSDRYCQDCIQYAEESDVKDIKRHHCWAFVSDDFKSDIHFYNVSGNFNEKISQRVYIDQILKPVVKPWLDQGHDFVLKKDDDLGHEPGKSNIVRTWKEKHHLEHYFNCVLSPDLAPIENCWVVSKQHLRKFSYWDNATTKELILEG